ncbi:MAG: hypothetical protein AAGB19_12315 [Cyanobacteria bacterium P01_F01_bin.3]
MSNESKAPQNIQRLAQLIRRQNGDSSAGSMTSTTTSNVVPHPAILPAKLSEIDDPVMVLALLEGKQRDLHTDIQTINRATHRATAQNLERITAIERRIEQLFEQSRGTQRQAGIIGQQLDILLPAIDELRAEVALMQTHQDKFTAELMQHHEVFQQLTATIKRISEKRFTTTHILLIITSILVVATLITGQFRSGNHAALERDIKMLYENDSRLQQQLWGR